MDVFFESISSVEFNTSDNLILWVLSIILIGIFVSIYIFKDSIHSIAFRDDYYWYYIIAIINLVNIIAIIYYYLQYNGKYKGDPGKKGEIGKKGERGKFITCSYCKDNVYMERTSRYEPIIMLDPSLEEGLSFLENTITEVILSGNKVSPSEIDPASIIESLFKMDSVIYLYFMNQWNQLIPTIVKHINDVIIGKFIEGNIGNFSRPSGKEGFFPLGDTAFNAMTSNKMSSFMVAGNVRNPVRYELMSNFYVPISTSELPDLQLMKILKIIPPSGYVAFGDAVQRGSNKISKTLFGCIGEECVKELPKSDMECVFAHYSLIDAAEILLIPSIDDLIDININQLMFTVWRTPMNTIYINTGDDYANNTLIYNIINGNSDYLDSVGAVNEEMTERVKERLMTMKLTPALIAFFITAYFAAKIVITLPQKIDEYRTQLMAPFKSSKTRPTAAQRKTIINNIQAMIDNTTKEIIKSLDIGIRDSSNAYDVLIILFGSNLNVNLAVDEEGMNNGGVPMFNVQRVFLRMLKLLFPPNRPVYILKNECVAYYRVDESRQLLIGELEDSMNKYAFLRQQYLENGGQQCASLELVNNYQLKIDDEIRSYMVGFPNYEDSLKNKDFEKFNDNRLKYIIGKYKELNDVIRGKCVNPS